MALVVPDKPVPLLVVPVLMVPLLVVPHSPVAQPPLMVPQRQRRHRAIHSARRYLTRRCRDEDAEYAVRRSRGKIARCSIAPGRHHGRSNHSSDPSLHDSTANHARTERSSSPVARQTVLLVVGQDDRARRELRWLQQPGSCGPRPDV